jgi:hypothetical protein
MWFWIGLALLLLWGGWGYWRRRWWLRSIERSLGEAQQALRVGRHTEPSDGGVPHYQPPPGLIVPDRIITAIAGAAAIIGLFLVVASHWGWFQGI